MKNKRYGYCSIIALILGFLVASSLVINETRIYEEDKAYIYHPLEKPQIVIVENFKIDPDTVVWQANELQSFLQDNKYEVILLTYSGKTIKGLGITSDGRKMAVVEKPPVHFTETINGIYARENEIFVYFKLSWWRESLIGLVVWFISYLGIGLAICLCLWMKDKIKKKKEDSVLHSHLG